MRVVTLYRSLLLLPVTMPFILMAPARYLRTPLWFDQAMVTSYLALWIGGGPYLILIVGLVLWMRGKPEAQIRRAMFLSALMMVPLLGIFLLAIASFSRELPLDRGVMVTWGMFSAYALVLGYAYVAMAVLIVWLAKRLRVIAMPGQSVA